MKNFIILFILVISSLLLLNSYGFLHSKTVLENYVKKDNQYWLVLIRNKNIEYLYRGTPGDARKSELVRTFEVKVGAPGESPTPIPTKLGRKYWVIDDKLDTRDNPETAPFFIKLDVPGGDIEPFGPVPYEECDGQCYWKLSGPFGLHGVNGDMSRIQDKNAWSSGCIRHSDQDIVYLYNLINIEDNVRYYITEDYLPFSKDFVKPAINTSNPTPSFALTKTGEYF